MTDPVPASAVRNGKVATRRLEGAVADAWIGRVCAAVTAGRLNAQYPEAARVRAHLQAMTSQVHRGLYAGIDVDPRSCLPTYREWVRVRTDGEVALQELPRLPSESELAAKAARDPGSIQGRLMLKRAYYEDLAQRPLAPLGDAEARLRKADPSSRTAWFLVVLDKVEANGLYSRYSVALSQQSSMWRRPLVRLDQEQAGATDTLRAVVFRMATFGAEATFAQLASLPDLRVESVVRGTIGPFAAPEVPLPWDADDAAGEGPDGCRAALHSLVADRPGAVAGSFTLDMAACDLSADRDNDPFEDPLAAALSPGARLEWERGREGLGYRVFRDRKFAVTRGLEDAVKALCAARGTRNVVHVI